MNLSRLAGAGLILFGLLLPACRPSASGPAERPPDFSLRYYEDNGSLPPEYHHEYDLRVGPDGQAELTVQLGYRPEDHEPITESFSLSSETMDTLYAQLREQGLFRRGWQAENEPPAGGGAQFLQVTADGKEITVPAYLERESDRQAAEAMYAAVRGLVPAELWAQLEAEIEAYEAQANE